jgi:class 3 adenylate cyclase
MEEDWETYTEALAHAAFGWSEGEEAHRFAAVIRECVSPEVARLAFDLPNECDVTDLLPKVQAPTLVVQRRGYPLVPMEATRELAAKIPNAQLALLEGTSGATYVGNMEAVLAAIDEFLDEGEEAATPVAKAAPGGLVTIVFTDMEGSTATRQRLGDAKAQEVLRAHNTIVRDALRAHDGSEIKHTGDGIMASFPSTSGALQAAIAIQRAVAAHVEEHPDAPLRVYIGLNAGEPIAEEQDLFGTAVDLARRICDHAQPGEILVSDVVRQLAESAGGG